MKVIIQGYNTCCQNKAGGVQTRIRKIASLLQERGLEVELFNPFESDIASCDVLHIFKLGVENLALVQAAKKQGKRVVMSAVAPIVGKGKLRFYKAIRRLPLVTSYKIMLQTVQLTDVVIVETKAEADYLHSIYSVPYTKMTVVPNGLDIDDYQGDEIFDALGKRCEYILQVGRFDENKNQLNIIKALKGKDIDVVFIGGADHTTQGYFKKCEDAAKGFENIHLLGWQPKESKMLKSAYSNAKLVILPSHFETFGLVALEGGVAGANLAFSETLPILCYSSFKDCVTFRPDNVNQIREALTKAFAQPKDESLREKLIQEFDWNIIIDQHIEIYEGNH